MDVHSDKKNASLLGMEGLNRLTVAQGQVKFGIQIVEGNMLSYESHCVTEEILACIMHSLYNQN